MSRLSFSVVINTYNRAELLRTAVASLLRLRHPRYEIVVVNGPSTDDTERVLREFGERLKVAHCSEANLSRSRNIGIAASAGEIIAFIDDDATAEPNWLCELEPPYADPNVCAVGGFTRDQTGYDFQWKYMVCDEVRCVGESFDSREKARLNGHLTPNGFLYPSGVNSSFRRSALLEVGGFDEFYAYNCDESDLVARLIERGYSISCAPAAQVHHRFAASHIRSAEHVPKSFSAIARSRGYFAARHPMLRLPMKAVIAGCSNWLSEHLRHVSNLAADKKIGPEDARRLTRELNVGLREGLREGLRNPVRRVRSRGELDQGGVLKVIGKSLPDRMLRICFVAQELAPERSGAVGTSTWAVARGLAAAGHEVSVVTASNAHTRIDFEQDVWMHRIRRHRFPGRPGPDMPEVPPRLRDHLLAVRDEVLRIHAVRGLDVISAPISNVEGMALMATAEIPVALSLHTPVKAIVGNRPDWQVDPERMPWANHLIAAERWCLQRAELVVASSQRLAAEFEKLYDVAIERERLSVVPRGLPDFSALPENLGRRSPDITALFVGRQEPRKGVDLLLQAIPPLLERFPHLRFVFMGEERPPPGGDITYAETFRRQHAGAAWLGRVDFRGLVSEDTRDKGYRDCDIVVAPSRFEASGLVLLEAMKFGKPVVACRTYAAVEIVEDGITGVLVAPDDPAELAGAIAQLVAFPTKRDAIASEARQAFLRRFTLRQMIRGQEDAFFALLDRRRRHRSFAQEGRSLSSAG